MAAPNYPRNGIVDRIVFNRIDKIDSKIGFEMSLIVVEAILCGRCDFHDSNSNGFRDIWWTVKLIYFSIIDNATNHKI